MYSPLSNQPGLSSIPEVVVSGGSFKREASAMIAELIRRQTADTDSPRVQILEAVASERNLPRVMLRVSQRVDAIEPVRRSSWPRSDRHDEGSASTGVARDPQSFRRRRNGCVLAAVAALLFTPSEKAPQIGYRRSEPHTITLQFSSYNNDDAC